MTLKAHELVDELRKTIAVVQQENNTLRTRATRDAAIIQHATSRVMGLLPAAANLLMALRDHDATGEVIEGAIAGLEALVPLQARARAGVAEAARPGGLEAAPGDPGAAGGARGDLGSGVLPASAPTADGGPGGQAAT